MYGVRDGSEGVQSQRDTGELSEITELLLPGCPPMLCPDADRIFAADLRSGDLHRRRLLRAWGSALQSQFPAAALGLSDIRKNAPAFASQSSTQALAALLEAFIHLCGDNGSAAYECAHSMMNRMNEPGNAYAATVFCRVSQWLVGDPSVFVAIGRRTAPSDPSRRTSLIALMDRSVEAMMEMRQLRLPMAARLSRDVLDAGLSTPRSSTLLLIPRIVLAQLAYELGDFLEADSAVRAVLPRIRSTFLAETAIAAYVTLARSAMRRGRSDFAGVMLREGEALGSQRHWPRLSAACLVERIDLLIALGRVAEAAADFDRLTLLHWSGGYRGDDQNGIALYYELGQCRMLTLSGGWEQQALILDRLILDADRKGDGLLAVRLRLRLAAASARMGNETVASAIARDVIQIACASGLYQTILDAGDEVKALLPMVRDQLSVPHLRVYVTTLLEHWPSPAQNAVSKGERRSEGMLTSREQAVLHLMSLGHSNKRIAQRLGIAPETVKSHAKNIFTRLGSGTRTEAVSRAASLGII